MFFFFPSEFASTWQTLTFLDSVLSVLFFSSGKLIGSMQRIPTDSGCGREGGSGGVPERFASLLFMFARRWREHSFVPPLLKLRSPADTWLASRNQAAAAKIRGEGGGGKLCGCASTFIFFITKPALTQIMERTGSLSERQ